jgi:predicted PurR-regulated permease PerM
MKQRTITLRLNRTTWLALLGLGVALYVAVEMLPLLINVGLLLFLAALLALLISPLADRLAAHKVPRGWTVMGVLLIIVAVFTFLVFQLVPLIVNSLRALAGLVETLGPDAQAYLPDWFRDSIPTDTGAILGFVSNVLSQAAGTVGGIAGQLGTIFFTLFVLVVLVSTLVNESQVRQSLLEFVVPQRYHARVIRLTHRLSDGLSRWFVAQLSISIYYIVSYAVVNTLIGVPFALPISIIAGLLEFIPYLGGVVGLGLSVLAAATVSIETVIWVVVTNTIIGSVAVYFVSPFFYSRAINIPVAAVLLGLFIGGQVGGFFAALLTIPVVTVLLILLRELRPSPASAIDDLEEQIEEEAEETGEPATVSEQPG